MRARLFPLEGGMKQGLLGTIGSWEVSPLPFVSSGIPLPKEV